MSQVRYVEATQADEGICPDADLVSLLRAGDESAIAQLVDEWSPAMLRVARSFVGSPQSAEDVVQDTWLGMLSGLARFEGRSSLRTWAGSWPDGCTGRKNRGWRGLLDSIIRKL